MSNTRIIVGYFVCGLLSYLLMYSCDYIVKKQKPAHGYLNGYWVQDKKFPNVLYCAILGGWVTFIFAVFAVIEVSLIRLFCKCTYRMPA